MLDTRTDARGAPFLACICGPRDDRVAAVILSANDPVAAWGGVKLLRERFAIEPCVVTGPATDNQVGVEIVTQQLQVPAFNAMSNGAALGDCVIESLGLKPAVAVA